MEKAPLYHEIAESIRQAILYGDLVVGDRLPPISEMAKRWSCSRGTVQQAYQELSREGLVTSRPGQGTRVGNALSDRSAPLRQAALIHRAESLLLEAIAGGHQPAEVDRAFHTALDRWRAVSDAPPPEQMNVLRFVGSHDPAISLVASRFGDLVPDGEFNLTFAGSLGGLIALAAGEAEVAGCHLWDEETDTYNEPFIRRLLPGRRVVCLTLAHRRLGLILPPGNPADVAGLEDLSRPGLRFVNRQRGAGTRVWLDAQLHLKGIDPGQIVGYDDEVTTHSEVGRAVAEGRADAGLGIEAAALETGLHFIRLTTERYDLAIRAEVWSSEPVQALAGWLVSDAAREALASLGGYEIHDTGRVEWLD